MKQLFISSLTFTARLNVSFIHQLNSSIKVLCQKHSYTFIDNSSVPSQNLWPDQLHLSNSGKSVLLNSYIVTVNDSYFLGPFFTPWILTAFIKSNVVHQKKSLIYIRT